MKLTKVMWPEILKGTRGNGALIEVCRDLSNCLDFRDEGISVHMPATLRQDFQLLLRDSNSASMFIQGKRHLMEKAPNYHICEDFCEALWKIPDRELPVSFIPNDFMAYVSFPDGLLRDDTTMGGTRERGEVISGAYIYVGIADHRTPLARHLWGHRCVWISYAGDPDRALKEGRFPGLGRLVFDLQEGISVSEMLGQVSNNDYVNSITGQVALETTPEELEFRRKLASLMLNVALYVQSEGPNLIKLTPTFGGTVSHVKKHTQQGHSNGCTLSVIAVNWDYSADANWVNDETFVDTHPRWQRHGPGNSLLKLIWVKGHLRTYQKRVNPESAQPKS